MKPLKIGVLAFHGDVIEHIQDDYKFLRKSSVFLKSGGKIIMTVPADMKLWSKLDEVVGHKRRYTKKTLTLLLEKCGYKVEFISYFNFLLYLPQLIYRKLSQFLIKKQDYEVLVEQLKPPPALINIIFSWIFLMESQSLKRTHLPFGASLIIIGVKKS